jgi:hypothetical protein
MKAFKTAIFILVLGATCLAQAPSDQPATKADILQMWKEMRFEQQMQTVMSSMTKQFETMFDNMMKREEFQKLSEEKREKFKQEMNREMQMATQIYPITEIMDDFAPIYAKYMTKADVQAVTAFYRSPAGRRMLDNSPKIAQEGMAIIGSKMQTRMMQQMDQIQARMKAIMDEKSEAGTESK